MTNDDRKDRFFHSILTKIMAFFYPPIKTEILFFLKKKAAIVCACAILKDRPVCYGTSRLKSRVCAVTRCALLRTPTLKSNKRLMPIDNPSLEISSHIR